MFMIKKKNCIYHAWLILNLIIINDENERWNVSFRSIQFCMEPLNLVLEN